jgi:two-component system sensor histidine kinase KdpD
MLEAARERKREGVDVVVGVVETHGRKETEVLLEGLEVVPRRRIEYRGQSLQEMDLDAILARRPDIVLVDELAHTNAPGSRHPKRYSDVEELLKAGIEVYSTVNIQHLESLNDVVAQITGVRVRGDAIYRARAVILTTGTFLQALMHTGEATTRGGRASPRVRRSRGRTTSSSRNAKALCWRP